MAQTHELIAGALYCIGRGFDKDFGLDCWHTIDSRQQSSGTLKKRGRVIDLKFTLPADLSGLLARCIRVLCLASLLEPGKGVVAQESASAEQKQNPVGHGIPGIQPEDLDQDKGNTQKN